MDGYDYCQMISDSARVRASRTSVYGYLSYISGAGATAAGAAIPLAKSGELEFKHKFTSASLLAAGTILIVVGQSVLKRSDAASKLEGETASVLGQYVDNDGNKVRISSEEAASKCNDALGAWAKSRADATALASNLLEKKKADAEKAEGKATDANKKATKAFDVLDKIKGLCPNWKCADDKIPQVEQMIDQSK